MGNSTNLFSDITAARSSVANASNAILTNTAHLSSAAKDFVTIVERMEQRYKELEEKEADIAKKNKELDEKNKAMAAREVALNQREQKIVETEKLWGELRRVMESNNQHPHSHSQSPYHSPPPERETTPTITTTSTSSLAPQTNIRGTSPRTRTASVSEGLLGSHLKRPEVVSSDPPFVIGNRGRTDSTTPEPHLPLSSRGCVQTPELAIPTSLLTPAAEAFNLWLPSRTFSLAYKATRDGFAKADFHRLCDNKGPTVALIFSDKGYLFGGYAPVSWGRTPLEGYDTHPDCFLFTLTNPHNLPPTQYKLRHGNAYGLRNGQHVSFGWCGDIRIADDNAHLSNDSTSNFARSFIDTTNKGPTTFTGEYRFKVLEIEVYLVM